MPPGCVYFGILLKLNFMCVGFSVCVRLLLLFVRSVVVPRASLTIIISHRTRLLRLVRYGAVIKFWYILVYSLDN